LHVPVQSLEWDGKVLPGKPAVASGRAPESITLIPYGCTKFRVALLPITERTYKRSGLDRRLHRSGNETAGGAPMKTRRAGQAG
jgi:hypothetical protein